VTRLRHRIAAQGAFFAFRGRRNRCLALLIALVSGFSGAAYSQGVVPDAGRLLEGTRAPAAQTPSASPEINIGTPLSSEPRRAIPRKPVREAPAPQPAEVAGASGPFTEKDLLGLVSGILGKQVTAEELRELRGIALAIVACYRSPACANFAKQMQAASGIGEDLKGGIAEAPKAPPAPRFKVAGFKITGATAFEEEKLAEVVKEYAGQELTLEEMKDAAALVEEFYRGSGYFLARAFLPQQTSKDGVVEIAVLEGKIGDVKLQASADSRLNSSVAEGLLANLQAGTLIDEKSLERALLLLSDIPGTRVRSTLSPGEQVGAADLRVELEDTGERVTGSLEADNYGSKHAGQDRYAVSMNLINPSGYGDILGARVMRTTGEETTSLGRLSYTLPVGPWGTRLGINYSELSYAVGGIFSNLQSNGEAKVTSLFVQHPFIRTRNRNLYGFLGFDHKDLQDRFDSILVENPRRSHAFLVGVSGDLRDNMSPGPQSLEGGMTSFSFTVAHGEIGFRNANQDAADKAITGRQIGGTAYNKYNFSISRLQGLAPDWTAMFSLNGQMASKNLDSSEKISIGGPTGVRAYPAGELPADQAWIANAELRYAWRVENIPGEFGVFGFYDYARAELNKNRKVTDTNNAREISGWGLGLNWGKPSDFTVRLMAAFRPSSSDLPTADPTGNTNRRIWFQATKWW